jgi:hypothetical protein
VDFLADATVLDASEYSHVENRPHIATEWNITWTKIQQEAGNMPLNIVTNSDGPTRDFENACCGDLNTLEINLPLNKTFLKFRVRFQASNLLWSEWSEYTEFVTRNKDYKRAGNNPARDGVTFTDRGATVQGN